MKEANEKKITKILPCSGYDIERIESWLSSMAEEGLLLHSRSPFWHTLLRFLPGTPRACRYRLEPRVKGMDNADAPPEEALEIAWESGWEYVCPFEDFYIYRTSRPDAPEMNTDTAVQAASLKGMKSGFFFALITEILIILRLVLGGFGREPYRFLVTFGSLYVVMLVIFFGSSLVYDFLRAWHIFRLQKNLRHNIPMDHNKPWRPRAGFHRLSKAAGLGVSLLAITLFLSTCTNAASIDSPPVEAYPGHPPFPVLSDLYPGSTATSAGMDGMYNYYQHASSDCAPNMLDWRQFVTLRGANGESYGSRTVIIQYYETDAPWMAQGLARDFLRREAQWKDPETLEALTYLDLGLDYAVMYQEILPTVILQHENIMVRATISNEADLSRWTQLMAAQLKNEN